MMAGCATSERGKEVLGGRLSVDHVAERWGGRIESPVQHSAHELVLRLTGTPRGVEIDGQLSNCRWPSVPSSAANPDLGLLA